MLKVKGLKNQEASKIMDNLPPAIQTALFDENVKEKFDSILKLAGAENEDLKVEIQNCLLEIFLGFAPVEKFSDLLINEARLSPPKALLVSRAIEREIFNPLKESLDLLQKRQFLKTNQFSSNLNKPISQPKETPEKIFAKPAEPISNNSSQIPKNQTPASSTSSQESSAFQPLHPVDQILANYKKNKAEFIKPMPSTLEKPLEKSPPSLASISEIPPSPSNIKPIVIPEIKPKAPTPPPRQENQNVPSVNNNLKDVPKIISLKEQKEPMPKKLEPEREKEISSSQPLESKTSTKAGMEKLLQAMQKATHKPSLLEEMKNVKLSELNKTDKKEQTEKAQSEVFLSQKPPKVVGSEKQTVFSVSPTAEKMEKNKNGELVFLRPDLKIKKTAEPPPAPVKQIKYQTPKEEKVFGETQNLEANEEISNEKIIFDYSKLKPEEIAPLVSTKPQEQNKTKEEKTPTFGVKEPKPKIIGNIIDLRND